jgi:hypothetical protein
MARGILKKSVITLWRSPNRDNRDHGTPPIVVPLAVFGGNREFRNGAPRPMKMGTIASPWRYDAVLKSTLTYPMTCASLRAHSDGTVAVLLFRFKDLPA